MDTILLLLPICVGGIHEVTTPAKVESVMFQPAADCRYVRTALGGTSVCRRQARWEMTVRTSDGDTHVMTTPVAPSWKVGDVVQEFTRLVCDKKGPTK